MNRWEHCRQHSKGTASRRISRLL